MTKLISTMALVCASFSQLPNEIDEQVDVTLRVVDSFGRERPYTVVSFRSKFPSREGGEFASRFRGMTVRGLRRLPYIVVLDPKSREVSGITREGGECRDSRIEQQIDFSGSGPTLVVVESAQQCNEIMVDYREDYRVRWKLASRPPGRLWVRVRPIFHRQAEPADAEVDGAGEFRVNPLGGDGLYVVSVFREGTLLGHATAVVERKHFGNGFVPVPWK